MADGEIGYAAGVPDASYIVGGTESSSTHCAQGILQIQGRTPGDEACASVQATQGKRQPLGCRFGMPFEEVEGEQSKSWHRCLLLSVEY